MKRIILIVIVSSLCGMTGLAQQHEFSLNGGIGLSTLSYTPAVGEKNGGIGGQFGLGYRYYITPQWSGVTGIGYSIHNAGYKINSLEVNSRATDIDNDDFDFKSTLTGYEEKQKAAFLQIPLMGQYQNVIGTHQFYGAAGFKFGIPLGGNYNASASTIKNTGYYAEPEDMEYEEQEFMGFGPFNNRAYNGKSQLNLAIFFSLEAGFKFMLQEKLSVYAGVFFDYGLNNISKPAKQPFVEYNSTNPRNFTVNSIAHSEYKPNESFTDKIIPMAVGIKVALAFALGE